MSINGEDEDKKVKKDEKASLCTVAVQDTKSARVCINTSVRSLKLLSMRYEPKIIQNEYFSEVKPPA